MNSGAPGRGSRTDLDGVRQEVDRMARERRRDGVTAIIITDERPFYLRSPNGNYWSLKIDNAGVLSATNIGPQL